MAADLGLGLFRQQVAQAQDEVLFNRDIRSTLARKCFACHGQDDSRRLADLRLDARTDAIDGGAILPGHPDSSELIARVTSIDEAERMPPPKSGGALNSKEIDLHRRWIRAGAPYDQHWSVVTPQAKDPPLVAEEAWVRNPMDRFVLQTAL